jgi:serine/threonine protein kinase
VVAAVASFRPIGCRGRYQEEDATEIMATCPQCQSTYSEDQAHCPKDGSTLIPGVITLDPDLARGSKVGEYVIEHKIGAGTFGDVYQGVQPLIGKLVAVKVLSRKYSADPMVVSRFIAEARAVNQIRHQNIIDIFSFGQLPDGRHYHVMELLDGEPLNTYVASRGGRLEVPELLGILRGLGRALDAAHAAGIAHRDLKPANVFLAKDRDGTWFPKLLDFGIAKLMTDDLPRQHQTATGAAVGTPDYMSPEQCQGPDVDHRTDIYAFGVVSFQLLTGRLPFRGNNVVELLMKHLSERPPRPSEIQPELSPHFDAPLLAMLEKDPERRPSSLQAAVRSLEEAARAAGFEVTLSQTGDPVVRSGNFPSTRPFSGSQPVLAAATLAPALDGPALAKPKNTTPVLIGAVVVLALTVTAGMRFFPRSAPVAEVTALAVPKPVPARQEPEEIDSPPLPTPAKVQVHFNGRPRGAEVVDNNGVVLGRLPLRLELVAGTPVVLRFRAPGFAEVERPLVPVASGTIAVELRKIGVIGRGKGRLKKEGARPGRDDLEVPAWESP